MENLYVPAGSPTTEYSPCSLVIAVCLTPALFSRVTVAPERPRRSCQLLFR
jgi:hypothetical protein